MNPEHNPEFNLEKIFTVDRIYARTPEDKKDTEIYINSKFENQEWDKISNKELNKTSDQLKIIDLANEYSNNVLSQFGLEKLNITEKNIHIFKNKDYKKFFKEEINPGFEMHFSPKRQAILSQEENSNLRFALKIFHEIIHFKSFYGTEMKQEDSHRVLSPAQVGIELRNKKGDKLFSNLNEAITESLAKKFFKEVSKKSLFQDEMKEINKAKKDWKGKDSDFSQDIFRVYKTKKGNSIAEAFSYHEARKVLNLLVGKLYSKNFNDFKDHEEIFSLFIKSVFTGDIVGKNSWGRLVDKTFGTGTLKSLAEKDSDLKELKQFVDSL